MVSKIDEIYPEDNKDEEFSLEELMKRKWKKPTKIRKTIYIPDPMDETLVVERKEEMSRKSRYIPIRGHSTINENSICENSSSAEFIGFSDAEIIQSTGILKNEPFLVFSDENKVPIVVFEDVKEIPKIIRSILVSNIEKENLKETIADSTLDEVFKCPPIQRIVDVEENLQTAPIKPTFSIFEDSSCPDVEKNPINEPELKKTRFNEDPNTLDFPIFEDLFAPPDPVPVAITKKKFIKPAVPQIIQYDETDETVCNTQHFNLFLKSSQASTPSGKLLRKSLANRKPIIDFDLDDFPPNEIITNPAAVVSFLLYL